MMELPKRHATPLKVSRFAPMQKTLTGFLSAAPPPLTTGRNFEAGQRTWILHGSLQVIVTGNPPAGPATLRREQRRSEESRRVSGAHAY